MIEFDKRLSRQLGGLVEYRRGHRGSDKGREERHRSAPPFWAGSLENLRPPEGQARVREHRYGEGAGDCGRNSTAFSWRAPPWSTPAIP